MPQCLVLNLYLYQECICVIQDSLNYNFMNCFTIFLTVGKFNLFIIKLQMIFKTVQNVDLFVKFIPSVDEYYLVWRGPVTWFYGYHSEFHIFSFILNGRSSDSLYLCSRYSINSCQFSIDKYLSFGGNFDISATKVEHAHNYEQPFA